MLKQFFECRRWSLHVNLWQKFQEGIWVIISLTNDSPQLQLKRNKFNWGLIVEKQNLHVVNWTNNLYGAIKYIKHDRSRYKNFYLTCNWLTFICIWMLRFQYQNEYIFNLLITVNVRFFFISMVLELTIWNQPNIHQTVWFQNSSNWSGYTIRWIPNET